MNTSSLEKQIAFLNLKTYGETGQKTILKSTQNVTREEVKQPHLIQNIEYLEQREETSKNLLEGAKNTAFYGTINTTGDILENSKNCSLYVDKGSKARIVGEESAGLLEVTGIETLWIGRRNTNRVVAKSCTSSENLNIGYRAVDVETKNNEVVKMLKIGSLARGNVESREDRSIESVLRIGYNVLGERVSAKHVEAPHVVIGDSAHADIYSENNTAQKSMSIGNYAKQSVTSKKDISKGHLHIGEMAEGTVYVSGAESKEELEIGNNAKKDVTAEENTSTGNIVIGQGATKVHADRNSTTKSISIGYRANSITAIDNLSYGDIHIAKYAGFVVSIDNESRRDIYIGEQTRQVFASGNNAKRKMYVGPNTKQKITSRNNKANMLHIGIQSPNITINSENENPKTLLEYGKYSIYCN